MPWDVAKTAGWMRISQELAGSSRGTLCLKWTREGFGVQGAERSAWLEGCTAGRVEEAGAGVGAPSHGHGHGKEALSPGISGCDCITVFGDRAFKEVIK